MKALALLAAALLFPVFLNADHKSSVGGTYIVDSTDANIRAEHGENCAVRHYHGELNGIADPAPDGCGHGEIKAIAHGDGDGESLPVTTAKPNVFVRAWNSISAWWDRRGREDAKNVVDVAAEANGIPPPFQVAEIVDIVKDETPAIKEKIDTIKEYRETTSPEDDTLGIYTAPTSGGNADGSDTISQRFFKWFNSLVK